MCSGWPSFFDLVKDESITVTDDFSYGMHRVETTCSQVNSKHRMTPPQRHWDVPAVGEINTSQTLLWLMKANPKTTGIEKTHPAKCRMLPPHQGECWALWPCSGQDPQGLYGNHFTLAGQEGESKPCFIKRKRRCVGDVDFISQRGLSAG